MISLIAAIGQNRELGANNDLMWRLRDDMKLFMNTTTGHVVIMGRKSYEAMNGALKNRTNVVITRNESFNPDDAEVFHDIESAIKAYNKPDEEIFIIGGGQIYEQTMDIADRLYITYVHSDFPQAEVFFPEYDVNKYNVIEEFSHPQDERNEYSFTFKLYERK